MLRADGLELPLGVPMNPLFWLFVGCTPDEPSDPTASGTADTAPPATETGDTGTPSLPGTTERVPDEQLLGIVAVEWSDQSHLLPSLKDLVLDARFWAEVDFGSWSEQVLIPYSGLDTCYAYLVVPGSGGGLVPGNPGVLTVTLDDEVFFQGPPNDIITGDDLAYQHTRPEPAWGAAVGVSAEGDGPIPAFDLPLVGWLAAGPPGAFTPEHSSRVPLDGLTVTWDNPLGGEMNLQLALGWTNFSCVLEDDGHWKVPAEYLALIDPDQGNAANATLHKGTARYVPIGDEQYVLFHVRTKRSWSFGLER